MDAVLALRLLSELHHEFARPLNIAYIAIKATFDSVYLSALLKALEAAETHSFLLYLIQNLHEGTISRVRVGSDFSGSFLITSGVRQGCILAPALFCFTVDWILSC